MMWLFPLASEHAVNVMKAMADPVRFDLLTRIASVREMPCAQLVDEAGVSASTVSYHVRMLRTLNLIEVRKDGRNFHYTYRPETVRALTATLENLG